MHIYKITFIKNKIDQCKISDETKMEGDISFEKHHQFLIYALIKAESEPRARERAKELIDEIS